MPTYKLTICDENGKFLSGYNVSAVPGAGETTWPLPTTEIARQPFVFSLPEAKGISSLYIRGPGNLDQPDIINWSTYISLNRNVGGDIKFVLPRCEKQSCAPCGSVKGPAGDILLSKDSIEEAKAGSKVTAKGADPVQTGPTTLDCVDATIKVVDEGGEPVTDYLGQIRHQGLGNYIVEQFEIAAGKTLRIRNARHAMYSEVWRAGDRQNTFQSKYFNPESFGNDPVLVTHNVTAGPPKPAKTEAVLVANSQIYHGSYDGNGGGYKDNRFIEHRNKDFGQRRHDSSLASSIWNGEEKYAFDVVKQANPDANSIHLVALWNWDIGYFKLKENTGERYLWEARPMNDDGTLGAAMEQDIDVHRLLVGWENN